MKKTLSFLTAAATAFSLLCGTTSFSANAEKAEKYLYTYEELLEMEPDEIQKIYDEEIGYPKLDFHECNCTEEKQISDFLTQAYGNEMSMSEYMDIRFGYDVYYVDANFNPKNHLSPEELGLPGDWAVQTYKGEICDMGFNYGLSYVHGNEYYVTLPKDIAKSHWKFVRLYLQRELFERSEAAKALHIADVRIFTELGDPSMRQPMRMGDADGDYGSDLTINDAVKIMSYCSSPKKYPMDVYCQRAADVYNTGDGLSNMDALAIQRYLAGIEDSLPSSFLSKNDEDENGTVNILVMKEGKPVSGVDVFLVGNLNSKNPFTDVPDVAVISDTVTTDANGKAVIEVKSFDGNYYIEYAPVIDGGSTDYIANPSKINFLDSDTRFISINIASDKYNENKTGTINFRFIDQTGQPIQGVEVSEGLELRALAGSGVDVPLVEFEAIPPYVSDENGEISITNNAFWDKYIYYEYSYRISKVPENISPAYGPGLYISFVDETNYDYEFVLMNNDAAEIDLMPSYTLEITDEEGNPVEGAEVMLSGYPTAFANGPVDQIIKHFGENLTDKNGIASFTLPKYYDKNSYYRYKIEYVTLPDGYEFAEPVPYNFFDFIRSFRVEEKLVVKHTEPAEKVTLNIDVVNQVGHAVEGAEVSISAEPLVPTEAPSIDIYVPPVLLGKYTTDETGRVSVVKDKYFSESEGITYKYVAEITSLPENYHLRKIYKPITIIPEEDNEYTESFSVMDDGLKVSDGDFILKLEIVNPPERTRYSQFDKELDLTGMTVNVWKQVANYPKWLPVDENKNVLEIPEITVEKLDTGKFGKQTIKAEIKMYNDLYDTWVTASDEFEIEYLEVGVIPQYSTTTVTTIPQPQTTTTVLTTFGNVEMNIEGKMKITNKTNDGVVLEEENGRTFELKTGEKFKGIFDMYLPGDVINIDCRAYSGSFVMSKLNYLKPVSLDGDGSIEFTVRCKDTDTDHNAEPLIVEIYCQTLCTGDVLHAEDRSIFVKVNENEQITLDNLNTTGSCGAGMSFRVSVFDSGNHSNDFDIEYSVTPADLSELLNTYQLSLSGVHILNNQILIGMDPVTIQEGCVIEDSKIEFEVSGTADSDYETGTYHYGNRTQYCLINAKSAGTITVKMTEQYSLNNSLIPTIYYTFTADENGNISPDYQWK